MYDEFVFVHNRQNLVYINNKSMASLLPKQNAPGIGQPGCVCKTDNMFIKQYNC